MRNTSLLLALLLLTLVACHKSPSLVDLEECDLPAYLPCIQPDSLVSIAVPDSNLVLTYSSRWKNRPSIQGDWDATPIGLGGWSLNLVQRYDSETRHLIGGDGSWRSVDAVSLPSGNLAVPSVDGAFAYVFDSAGRHLGTYDGRLGIQLLKLSYDPSGRLKEVRGTWRGLPVYLSVQRDSEGHPHALIGIDGTNTIVSSNAKGQLTGVTNPAQETTLVGWNSSGLVDSKTDPAGNASRFIYDDAGRLSSVTDADGVTQRFTITRTADSFEAIVTTASGQRTSYRAENVRGGIRRTFSAADGTSSTETVDSKGVRSIKLADGTMVSVGATSHPIWKMAAPLYSPVTQTRIDGVTSRREMRYALRSQGGLPYVLAGSVITTINGQTWTQTFDPEQRSAALTNPAGRTTTVRYDGSGRVLDYSRPDAALVSYTYDTDGRMKSETTGTGTSARISRTEYDADSGHITVTRPDGTKTTTIFDRAGRAIGFSYNDGATVVARYDVTGRITGVQPPGGLMFTLGNSPAGRPTAFVPPLVGVDGSAEVRSYDADGNLQTISGLGKRPVSIAYDSGGHLTAWTFDQGKRTASYNPHTGLISEAADPSGVKTSYSFVGRVPTGMKWIGPVNGSVTTTLDENGRVRSEMVNGSSVLEFKRDAAGDLSQVGGLHLSRDQRTGLVTHTKLGVVETTNEFDDYMQLVRASATVGDKVLLDQRYKRDALGRIKSVSTTDMDGRTSTTEYGYDGADRLASVRIDNRIVESDTYDPAGNRTQVTRGGKTLQAAYDDRDRAAEFGSAKYSWSPNGSLSGRSDRGRTASFAYDDFGALRLAELPNGTKVTYVVDADGRRVGRTVGGGAVFGYLYRFNGTLAAEINGTGQIVSRFGYDADEHLALVVRDGIAYRVVTDAVGSPRLIVDSRTGAIADRIAYDAWGTVTEESRRD